MKSLEGFTGLKEFIKNLASISLNSDEFIRKVEKKLSKANPDEKRDAFIAIGLTLQQMSFFVLAVGTWNHILEHYVKNRDRTSEMWCHSYLGIAHDSLGHPLKAIEHFKKALQITIELHDECAEAKCYGDIGISYTDLGYFQEAIKYLKKGLQIFAKMNRKDLESGIYLGLGKAYNGLGDFGRAVEYYEKALEIGIETNTKEMLLNAYNNLGVVHHNLGQPGKAIEYLEKALQIAIESEDRYAQSSCYTNLGNAYNARGDLRKAFEYHKKALKIALDLENTRVQSNCYLALGITVSDGGDFRKAIDYYDKALQIAVEIKDQRAETCCYMNIGIAHRHLGNLEKAIEYSERALDTAKKTGDLDGERIINLSLGKIYYVYETKANCAYDYLRRSIELSDIIDERLAEDEHRIGFRGEASSAYQYVVPLCWQLGKVDEAFEYAERSKSRALLKLLSASNIKPSIRLTSQLKSLLNEEEQCLAELREIQTRHIRNMNTSVEPGAVERISERLNLIYNQIDKFDTEYVSLRKADPVSPDEIRSMLCSEKKNAVVLEYFITKDKVFIFVVSKNGLHVEPVSLSKEKLLRYVKAYEREVVNRVDYGAIGDTWLELSNYLIEPVSDFLAKSDLIYFIPYGALHYIPMHALEFNGEPLIKKHAVCYSPAASIIRFCKNKGTDRFDDCASFGVVFEDEAEEVAGLFKKNPYLGKTANKENVLSCTGRDIIHLSCHGKFDNFDPLSSGLLLHNEEILTAREIFNWRINAELVTLSACQTGLNERTLGDELIGLTRAFLYAGAPSVVVSLWSVYAPSTQELMLEFYKLLKKGKDKATALQEAQIEVMQKDEYTHPYFWAPFILVGDWE